MTRRERTPERTKDRNEILLAARGLTKHFSVKGGLLQRTVAKVRAVDGVDLAIHRGETVALVGAVARPPSDASSSGSSNPRREMCCSTSRRGIMNGSARREGQVRRTTDTRAISSERIP
jgi:ABC-type microcin C transport system duplicated ATPase subunit YejF